MRGDVTAILKHTSYICIWFRTLGRISKISGRPTENNFFFNFSKLALSKFLKNWWSGPPSWPPPKRAGPWMCSLKLITKYFFGSSDLLLILTSSSSCLLSRVWNEKIWTHIWNRPNSIYPLWLPVLQNIFKFRALHEGRLHKNEVRIFFPWSDASPSLQENPQRFI